MYNNGHSPEISNNPFINDPSNPQTRFPDISLSSPPTQWLQTPSDLSIIGYQAQQMYQQPLGFGYQRGQLNLNSGNLAPGLLPQRTGAPFYPTGSAGQHLATNVSGSSYGYLQGQSNREQQNSYHPAQQQLQNNLGYIAQFDPYASVGQGWDGSLQRPVQSQNAQGAISPTNSSIMTSGSPSGVPHPREYLRLHKAEVEAWDNYAWKQLLNAFEALKGAWEGRVKAFEGSISQVQTQLQYGGLYYPGQIQQEQERLQGLLKEAQSHFGSVAASSFQMKEVFEGYRQSADQASKQRVREASNAALNGLPDWPPPIF